MLTSLQHTALLTSVTRRPSFWKIPGCSASTTDSCIFRNGWVPKTKIIYFRLGGKCHKPMRISDEEATYKCMYEFLKAAPPLHCSSTKSAGLKQQGDCRSSSEATLKMSLHMYERQGETCTRATQSTAEHLRSFPCFNF